MASNKAIAIKTNLFIVSNFKVCHNVMNFNRIYNSLERIFPTEKRSKKS